MAKTLLLILLICCASAHAKIYDCFMFSHEMEILEIRLNELYDYVDKFVLVEWNEDHRLGRPKPFQFEQEKARFSKFLDKIIYIKLEEHIETDDGWARENWHRNQIMRGLDGCHDDDLISISDVDEFIPGWFIQDVYQLSSHYPMIGFRQEMYRWFLNRSVETLWSGTIALRYKHLVACSPQEARDCARGNHAHMLNAGWHFSSMGGYEQAKVKYDRIVEGRDSFKSYEMWRKQVEKHPLVTIDTFFPQFIQDNIDYLIEMDMIDVPQE